MFVDVPQGFFLHWSACWELQPTSCFSVGVSSSSTLSLACLPSKPNTWSSSLDNLHPEPTSSLVRTYHKLLCQLKPTLITAMLMLNDVATLSAAEASLCLFLLVSLRAQRSHRRQSHGRGAGQTQRIVGIWSFLQQRYIWCLIVTRKRGSADL